MDVDKLDFIIVENVGNLVCPAEFQIGADERIVLLSTTEGEDKPLKYPLAFNTSQTCIITKIDLLPHLQCDIEEMKTNIVKTQPKMNIIEASSTSKQGIDKIAKYFKGQINQKKSK